MTVDLFVSCLDESYTRRADAHDGTVVIEVADELLREVACLLDIAAVERELAATRLLVVVFHLDTRSLQQLHGVHRRHRIKLVDDTRYQEVYCHDCQYFMLFQTTCLQIWLNARLLTAELLVLNHSLVVAAFLQAVDSK